MPGKEKNIQTALDGIDGEIVGIVGDFVKRRKEHYEQLAKKLQENLKKDVKRYAVMLADEKISAADFELLSKGRWAQIQIELLSEASISKRKFEGISNEILRRTIKAVFEVV